MFVIKEANYITVIYYFLPSNVCSKGCHFLLNFDLVFYLFFKDVIRVKSYVDSFLDPAAVPVRISINKLYLFPKRGKRGKQTADRDSDRDSGIVVPEAWMPTIKKHNKRVVQQRTAEGATSSQNSWDRNTPITADHRDINGAA